MKLEQFIELVKAPANTSEQHIPSIEKILSEYPYFQTAHLLYAKALHNSNHINYRSTLKKTAVIAGNRTVLYRLIQSPVQLSKEVLPVEEKQEIVSQKTEVVQEKPVSNINITYDVVPTIKTEVTKEVVKEEPKVEAEVKTPEPEVIQPEVIKQETLDEVILKPVLEAYVDTEVLKITEKETPVNSEMSFSDWLKTLAEHRPLPDNSLKKQEKEAVKSEPAKPITKTEKNDIIDKLLNVEFKMAKPDPEKKFYAASEKAKVIENEELVTETLAKIYRLQGNNGKAIRAYEILSLKYPEKSAYFAALITEIKNSQK
ncbi:MAG: hypothetical protein ACXVOH_13185 [Bacteroidia bacterium]